MWVNHLAILRFVMGLVPKLSFDLHPYCMLTHQCGAHYLVLSPHMLSLGLPSQRLSTPSLLFLCTCCPLNYMASAFFSPSQAVADVHSSLCFAYSCWCEVLVVYFQSLHFDVFTPQLKTLPPLLLTLSPLIWLQNQIVKVCFVVFSSSAALSTRM